MADYYINSDYGKQLAGSLKAGDMAEASDGSTWRKEADGSVTVWKNGQTMTGRVGASAPAVPEAPPSSASPTVETPTLDAATGGSSQQPTAADYTGSAQEQRDQEQAQARLASEKAKAATEKVTAGLDQSSSDELLNQAIQQASTPEYKISSAQGVLLADELRMAGDMAEASDGSTWRREADGSISVRKGDRTYKANIDRAAAKQDPQWAILTAPAPAAAETGSGKKSSRKSSSGGSGTYTFPDASTGTQKTPTATATGTDRASLRKQAATAQKEMGDLARQISVAKIRGKDTSALQAKYNEAKARYDAANTQIQAPQQLSTSGARQEQFSQRQTLMELATQQAAERKDAWKSLPTVRDSERFSGIDNVTTGRMRGAEQQQIAGAVKALQKDAWRSLPTVQDSERFNIPSQTDNLMQQAIAQRQSAAQPQTDKGIGGKLFTMLGAGLGQFNSSIANFADAAATAVETVEGYLNGGFTKDGKFVKGDSAFTSSLLQPIHDWAKYTQSTSDSLNERSAANWSDTKAGSVANTIGTGVIAALPQAALALLTLGTSSAGTLTQASSGLAGSIETVMRRISSDPSYWLSFMQETGGNFAEAKGAGATDEQAILASTIAGLANAAIEVSGGLENNNWMNDGTLSALSKAKNLIKGAIEEGGEELIQNPISRAMQKLVYDGDREWLSLDNTAQGRDAVFNPYQSAEEFATGAAVGGILGAGNFALNRALGSRSQNQAQNTQLTQDELLDAAMQAANRGETLTGPVQAANQTTQQTTQGTAERGTEGVITGNEASALDEAMRSTFTEALSGISSDVATNKPQNVKNLLNATKEQITRFIQNAFNKQNQFQFLKISDVSPELAATLREAGIDVEGYSHVLRDNDIRHVDSSHGSMSNDKYKVTADVLGNVQDVIDNYDNLYRGYDTRNGNPTVVYEKRMGNRTFYVEEVLDSGILGTKQMVITGEDSNPSFLKKYTKIASALSETDVPTQSGSKGISPPGNHVPDAERNTSYNPTVAQSGNPVNQNVSANDMGAMRSQFESVPKQSQTQSNTINSMETGWDVPEAQRTPIMYDTISEAKSLDNARLRLAQDYAGEMAELRGKHNWSGEEVDMGMTILDNYRRAAEQTGDWTEYSNWRKEVSAHGTAAGQALQAYAKYSRQTGGGIVADASAALERAAKKTNKAEVMNRVNALAQQYDAAVGTGQENAKVNVNDLVDIIKSASTARQTGTLIGNKTPPIVNWAMNRIANYARAEAQSGGGENLDFLRTFAADSIYNIAADTRAVSAGEQVKTVRRTGMLSKVSTVMRNLVSNNVFDPIDSIARNVSVPLDMLVSTITGTRSVAGDASWFSAAKRKGSMDGLARACMEVGLDVDASGTAGKYENTSNRTFKMSGGVFSKLMSVWEAYQGYTLNATDEFQKGGIEASVQKGIDRLYEKGKIKDDSLRNAGEQEALYRTFQDKTVLSDAAIGVRNALNKAHIGDIGAGDIMLPFAQVPSNLGARTIEYSPAGLGVAAADFINMIDSARKGEFTAAQQAKAVQGVGRALTGSGMIAIAAAGALRGWLKVTGDDDDKNKDALGKTHGLDGTQLNISAALRDLRGESAQWQAGDQLLSIGFLDPLNAQLTTGALIADDIRSEAGVTAGRVLGNSLSGALQSVLDTPVMSTFQDVATNYEYSGASTPGGKMMDAAQKYAANQLSSVIPNSLRGIAQGLDDTERNAYSSDNVWQQAVDNVKAAIPGLRETLPAKTDVWGNPVKNEGGIRNFMNRNINPGNVTTYKPDAVSSEIEKISEATNTSLYPDRTAPRSLKVDGEAVSLTFEQRSMYQKAYGDAYSAAVTSLMNDKNYKAMPDSMKAEILQQAKDAATEQARDSLGIGYEVKSSAQKILEKSGAERNNALISAAVKAQHYLSPETQKQLSDVDRQFGGADYVGLSDELFNAAKEKANTYFSAVEAAKYGGELTETQKELADKDSKELARYFMDKAIESRYTDTNKSGTKADEYLKAYRHGELNDAMALAVLSDKEVMAYDRFGRSAKVTPEMALQAANAHAGMKDVKDEDGKVTSSAQDQFDAWLDKQSWTGDQKSAVRMGFYSDSVKTYSYLADQLRKGNIKTADAKSELTTSYQAGWSKNVRDTGAKMADYIDAIVEYEDRPSEEERKAAGYKNTWTWFCDYLNTTDLTQEQKFGIAISMSDYSDKTKQKIWNRLR
nr:MAG TPA: nuclease [Caudoviricetes sp.]